MTTLTAADILEAALKLPEVDRERIAHALWESVTPLPPGILCEDDPGFFEELDRRIEEHRRDPSRAIPWEDALRNIETELDEARANRDRAATQSPHSPQAQEL